ncbi:MAG: hypothetical protein R2755_09390 [Acidimicrobiales bacterium]
MAVGGRPAAAGPPDEGRPLADEPVELSALVRDTVSDAAAVQPDRPVRADADGPLPLRGDEARLRQVIAAVVTNALVHTEPTTPVRWSRQRRRGARHHDQRRRAGHGARGGGARLRTVLPQIRPAAATVAARAWAWPSSARS